MICNQPHRYFDEWNNLPEDQGGEGRHKCAGCAYEAGILDGIRRNPKNINLESLNDSQAGTVRHKSPQAAYELGYQVGIKLP